MNLDLTKRQKIVFVSIVVTVGWIIVSSINIFLLAGYKAVIVLGLVTYLLSIWALWEGMTKLKAVILMILPIFFATSAPLFYLVGRSIWSVSWVTRLPAALLFGLSFYGLLLSQNVFNVASDKRTIPLYRAASTVAFFFTLLTSFFIYNSVFALSLPFYWNAVLVALVSFPLVLQLIWTIEMEKISSAVFIYSAIIALTVGELAMAFSFWPLATTIWSLALSTSLYVLLGIVTEHFKDRFSKRIVWEYLGVGGGVLLFTLLITSWTA